MTSRPTLHPMDLRFWLAEHPRCTKKAIAALQALVEGQPPTAIAAVAPDLDFLKTPLHLAALAQAGFVFTTLTVPETADPARLKHYTRTRVNPTKRTLEGDEVRCYAIYLDAEQSVHALLDESGVPPVPLAKASTWGADVARRSWVNSLRHLHRLYPHDVEQWASQSMVLASMAVKTWIEKKHKASALMVVDVIAWGMQVDKMRDHIKKTYPDRAEGFEALVRQGRAQRLEEMAPSISASTKGPRL